MSVLEVNGLNAIRMKTAFELVVVVTECNLILYAAQTECVSKKCVQCATQETDLHHHWITSDLLPASTYIGCKIRE